MNEILEQIQELLKPKFKYVDENWGQLGIPNAPVKWPCALIDCNDASFTNNSNNIRAIPQLRQEGTINIEITISNLRLTNSSGNAPQGQKNKAWEIYNLIEEAHKTLQGQTIGNGKLIRSRQQRVRRNDGIQEHRIIYTLIAHDC